MIILLETDAVGSGLGSDDQIMHSSILQNLTLSMDMNTDGGQLHASGQFMSGYAPIIKDSGVTGVATASDFEKGLFDCTAYTVGGHTITCSAFSMTITNPASRVGWILDESNHPTTDGYSRAGLFDISGTITVKYDANMADALVDWTTAETTGYTITVGVSGFNFSIASARMTGHNIDFADEGMFVEIPWTATTGAAGTGVLATIHMT